MDGDDPNLGGLNWDFKWIRGLCRAGTQLYAGLLLFHGSLILNWAPREKKVRHAPALNWLIRGNPWISTIMLVSWTRTRHHAAEYNPCNVSCLGNFINTSNRTKVTIPFYVRYVPSININWKWKTSKDKSGNVFEHSRTPYGLMCWLCYVQFQSGSVLPMQMSWLKLGDVNACWHGVMTWQSPYPYIIPQFPFTYCGGQDDQCADIIIHKYIISAQHYE